MLVRSATYSTFPCTNKVAPTRTQMCHCTRAHTAVLEFIEEVKQCEKQEWKSCADVASRGAHHIPPGLQQTHHTTNGAQKLTITYEQHMRNDAPAKHALFDGSRPQCRILPGRSVLEFLTRRKQTRFHTRQTCTARTPQSARAHTTRSWGSPSAH